MTQFPISLINKMVAEGEDHDELLGAIFVSNTCCEEAGYVQAIQFIMETDLEKFGVDDCEYFIHLHDTDQ